MKDGVNKAILIGRIGKEPELKELENNSLLKFSLATSESYKSKKTDQWEQSTEWHNIVVWGPRAQGLSKILRKGEPLYVEGKISTRSWEGNDGVKRYMTEIIARDVKLLGNKGGSSSSDQNQEDHRGKNEFSDDDIPF